MTGFHLKIHVGKKFPKSFKIVGGVSDCGLRSGKTAFLERAHIVKERTCKLYCDVFEVIVCRIRCKQLKQTKAKPTGTLLPAALQQASSLITSRDLFWQYTYWPLACRTLAMVSVQVTWVLRNLLLAEERDTTRPYVIVAFRRDWIEPFPQQHHWLCF